MKYVVSKDESTGRWIVVNIHSGAVVLQVLALENAAWFASNLNRSMKE